MIEVILEWSSSILFLVGVLLTASRKSFKPVFRIWGFVVCIIAGVLYVILLLIIARFVWAGLQIILICVNGYGIYGCMKEKKSQFN